MLDNVRRLDHGAVPMILHMQARGLQVDLAHFARMEAVLTADMERLTEDVRTVAGRYVNLDSGDQVSQFLFKDLGIKQARPKFTPSGDRESVDNEVLVAIQHEHPVVKTILDFKELSKLRGTYVVPMPKLARRVGFGEWRMFPHFGMTRIPSGRLNCKDPNLLAMPNRTARGRQVCEGFITDGGWCYLSVDESQIEPRVVAHRSADPHLRRVYFDEQDIYSDFAIAAFRLADDRYRDAAGWHYPGVDKKTQRTPSKICTLAAIYDVTNVGLLDQMPTICETCNKEADKHDCGRFVSLWTETKCQEILDRFYARYPGILTMRREDHRRARRYGYLWDEWGRLLHVTSVRSVHPWIQSQGLREAGNFPIQSTAQGTVKLAMAEVWDLLVSLDLFDVCHPLLQIHDELLFEVREDFAGELGEMVKSVFESCVRLAVPITAGAATSATWGALQK